MSADALLPRLAGVKRTGPGRWIARCPAHDDRHPSLSIRELEDGRVLLHCWAGCATEDVLCAAGLDWDAMMPAHAVDHHIPRERRPYSPQDVLDCIALESLIASIAASTLARGEPLSDSDRARLVTASVRLGAAAEMGGAA